MAETDGDGRADRPEPVVLGAVLVGGGSRRMGRDKASLVVGGAPLVERAVAALRAGTSPNRSVLVVGQDPDPTTAHPPAPVGSRWVSDLRRDAGPLAGLEAALAAAPDADAVLLTGVDHPWQSPTVLSLLSDGLLAADPARSAVVLGTARGPQLLIGAYRPSTLPIIRALLDAGERRLRSLWDHLDVEVIPQRTWRALDPLGATAVDVDDPQALAAAEEWHARAVATSATADDRPPPPARRHVLRVRGRDTGPADYLGDDADADLEVEPDDAVLPPEGPLVIRAAGPEQLPVTLTTLLCTPGHDPELAVGWLLGEGVASPQDILGVAPVDEGAAGAGPATITVRLRHAVHPPAALAPDQLNTTATSARSAGLPERCAARLAPITGDPFLTAPIPWSRLARLPVELRWASGAPSDTTPTGGGHTAGVFDVRGRAVTVRGDISRHNALDAVIGAHALRGSWPDRGLDDVVCTVSGRVGYRLVHTAATAGIPVLVAVGSASELAARAAERFGITLVGSMRDGHGTIHSHAGRVQLDG